MKKQDKVSTYASPTDIWSLWSLKTNVTVSKEVQSTKSFIPRPYHQDSKRTHVAVLSNPWVTLILRSQIISNGYISKDYIRRSNGLIKLSKNDQERNICHHRNGQRVEQKKYTETLKRCVELQITTALNELCPSDVVNQWLSNNNILNHCCKMESEIFKSITTLKKSGDEENEDKKTTRRSAQSSSYSFL